MSLKQQYRRRSRKASRRWRRRPWHYRLTRQEILNRILRRDPFLEALIEEMQKPVSRCPVCGELPGGSATLYTFLSECRNGHRWEPE